MTFPFPAPAIRGQGVAWTPGAGSSRHGAIIDSIGFSLANVPNNAGQQFYNLDNTAQDTDSYLVTASGAGEIQAPVKALQVPAGLDGLYVASVYAYMNVAPSTTADWFLYLLADDRFGASYASQVQAEAAALANFAGMGNSTNHDCAATVNAELPLVAGDMIGWSIGQTSGFVGVFYYARLSLYKIGA